MYIAQNPLSPTYEKGAHDCVESFKPNDSVYSCP